jgi:hypothetical protein
MKRAKLNRNEMFIIQVKCSNNMPENEIAASQLDKIFSWSLAARF